MLELYADQTSAGHCSILGGLIVNIDDLSALARSIMEFKRSEGLLASSPIKTAGWREDSQYRAMQRHPDTAGLLTRACSFVAGQACVKLIACVVDTEERGLSASETDYYLVQNLAKRLQFEVQERLGEYPKGPISGWYIAQQPRPKQGVKAKLIVDHPGSRLETEWDEHYRRAWRSYAHPYTHLMHLHSAISFEHTRSCDFLQLADIVVGAIRSYLVGGPRERFEILLPRFRQARVGVVEGWGLVFDPRLGRASASFAQDYPMLAKPRPGRDGQKPRPVATSALSR